MFPVCLCQAESKETALAVGEVGLDSGRAAAVRRRVGRDRSRQRHARRSHEDARQALRKPEDVVCQADGGEPEGNLDE